MTLPAGAQLGPYEIASPIGAGGMGEVYRARDARLDRMVAVKVLAPDRARDKDALARFAREAKTASSLNHPHIVHIYEVGEVEIPNGTAHYIAMELVEGETLRARLQAGARWKELLEPLTQVADALTRAHKAGIVHRDLKPENIMLTPDGYPKVLDFGLAKLSESSELVATSTPTASVDGRTGTGLIVGTPSYMSPEQAGGKAVDQRSDIFSFGCVLFEAATGQRPFKGASSVAMLHAIIYEEPSFETLIAQSPPELERIVRKCLAKDPERRYQTIKDVGNDLRGLAHGTAARLQSVGSPRRASAAPRWLIVATPLLVLGVLTGVLWRRRPTAAPPLASKTLQVDRVTNRGRADSPAISPDGRYLAYSALIDGRPSMLLRDLAEKSETQLLAGKEIEGVNIVRFAKDGQAVYCSFQEKGGDPGLYRIPLIGGEPRLVRRGRPFLSPDDKRLAYRQLLDGKWRLSIADLDTGEEKRYDGSVTDPAWSPDGARLLLTREMDGKWEAVVANADGTGERKVADLPPRTACRWWGPGDQVLCRVSTNDRDQRLVGLDVVKGTTQAVGDRLWVQIQALYWLPDGSGFFLNEAGAKERSALYRVSYPQGQVERIPADANRYWGLSMTVDGQSLVSVQTSSRSELLVSSDPEKGTFKRIASGTGVSYRACWTSDGRILYSSNEGGSHDLYLVDVEGKERQQLTFDRDSNEIEPAASPDGRYIVFVSDRSGENGLYRMNRDGTGLTNLTPKPAAHHADRDPRFTRDGRWVLYRHRDNGATLWKISIDGGTPVLIRGERPAAPASPWEQAFGASASPDGRSLAFLSFKNLPGGKTTGIDIAISSVEGQISKTLPFIVETNRAGIGDDQRVQWSRDGTTLFYVLNQGDERALWKRPAAGGPPIQVTHFEEPVDYFDWSLDGKTLVLSRSLSLSDVVRISNFR